VDVVVLCIKGLMEMAELEVEVQTVHLSLPVEMELRVCIVVAQMIRVEQEVVEQEMRQMVEMGVLLQLGREGMLLVEMVGQELFNHTEADILVRTETLDQQLAVVAVAHADTIGLPITILTEQILVEMAQEVKYELRMLTQLQPFQLLIQLTQFVVVTHYLPYLQLRTMASQVRGHLR
jgi:hypothetical protein